ncbi:MAG: ABC transporter ATP-binding protein [Spirochaetaceae bacterium]|nr:ABC transporter ATP-binding protein [Spirochaetaceae bacterium]
MNIGGGFTGAGGAMQIGAELQKAGDRRGTLRRFNHYLGGFRLPIAGIVLMVVVDVALTSYAPRMLQVAVDDIVAYLDGGLPLADARSAVAVAMVIALALFAFGWAANAVARWQMVGIGQGILANIRRDVFAKVHALSLGYFDSIETGDLVSRMANDTSVIDRVLRMGAVRMLQAFLQVIGILVAMLALSWRMALVSFTVLPVMVWFTWYFSRKARVAFRRTRQTMGVVSSHLERNIVGVREIQAFGRERANAGSFRRANAANRDANVTAETITAAFAPTLDVLAVIAIAVVLLWGGFLTGRDLVTIGVLVAFVQYVRRFFMPMRSMSVLWANIQSGIAGMERIFELLDDDRVAAEPASPAALADGPGRVELRGVSFAYVPDAPVLRDVDLTVEAGTMAALVGPTGAGKTTILALVQRLYDPTAGRILLDGQDVADLRRSHVRQVLGVVTQEPYLFAGTIADNIRYGRLSATDAEVQEAAERARADSFIRGLPDGYATVLTEGARNLSRGQQQLLAIARALIADPRVLILDEATANIDTRTERLIQQGLEELLSDRTSIVVAHRLSTVQAADLIAVIDDGRIVQQGTHRELARRRGLYRDLYRSQFSSDRKADRTAAR